jgi:hypothetical protein
LPNIFVLPGSERFFPRESLLGLLAPFDFTTTRTRLGVKPSGSNEVSVELLEVLELERQAASRPRPGPGPPAQGHELAVAHASVLSSTDPSVIAAFLRFWLSVHAETVARRSCRCAESVIECTVSPWRGERQPTRRW